MSPCRSAFIDIGTNNILCLIAELRDTGRFRILADLAEITRLGQGVDASGRISDEGEQRSRETLQRYLEHCRDLAVEEIHAVGTSALRDAANGTEILAQWRHALDLDVRILSGEEEAAYSFLAVQRGLSLVGQELLVLDIGGGSTEFIRGNYAGMTRAVSLDIGSVRLTERLIHNDPVDEQDCARLDEAIQAAIATLPRSGIEPSPATTLVGIAGTFTTLAAVEKQLIRYVHSEVHGTRLTLTEVRRQVALYRSKSIAERKQIPGLEAKRADVIFAGTLLIDRVMTWFGAQAVIVSDQGVRYGLLHERQKNP